MFCVISTLAFVCSWRFVFGFILLSEIAKYKVTRNAIERKLTQVCVGEVELLTNWFLLFSLMSQLLTLANTYLERALPCGRHCLKHCNMYELTESSKQYQYLGSASIRILQKWKVGSRESISYVSKVTQLVGKLASI